MLSPKQPLIQVIPNLMRSLFAFVLGPIVLSITHLAPLQAQDIVPKTPSDPAEVIGLWEYEVPMVSLRKQANLYRGVITIMEGPNGLTGRLQEIPFDAPGKTQPPRPRPGGVLIRLNEVQYTDGVLVFYGETMGAAFSRMNVNAQVKVEENEFSGTIRIQATRQNKIVNDTRTISATRVVERGRKQNLEIGD